MKITAFKNRHLPIFIGSILFLLSSQSGWSAPGDLDTSFDSDGLVVTDVTGNTEPDIGRAVAVQPDGKILVAGRTNLNFSLVRYQADGSLDTSFGNNGSAVTSIDNGDTAYAIAVQPDGKILVAGTSVNDFALIRYDSDGSLDDSFDGDGIVTTSFVAPGAGAQAFAIALQADGKIVLAGFSDMNQDPVGQDIDFALARFNRDGSLDTSFDGDGKVTTAIGGVGSQDIIYAVTIQPDGKIVAAGVIPTQDFVLVRYNPDGSLDSSFDADGIVTDDINGPDFAYSIALQADGKIVVAGQSFAPPMGPLGFAVARYNTDGTLDSTFSGDGKVVVPIPGLSNALAQALAIQPDGKIVLGGHGLNATTDNDLSVVRLNANGSLDGGFGVSGISTVSISPAWDDGFGLALQPDGNILQAGWRQTTSDFVVVRFEGSPSDVTPDAFSFDEDSNVDLNQPQTSNLITVSGLSSGVSVPVSVNSGEYTINASTTYTAGINWVANGDQLNVRHVSAASELTSVETVLRVGGVMAANSITHLGADETQQATYTTTTLNTVSAANTTISASPVSVSADGSTSTITVQAKDTNGINLTMSGGLVSLTQNGSATISAVTDNNDGSYSATINNQTAETVTVSGTIAGNAITDTAEVTFTEVSGGGSGSSGSMNWLLLVIVGLVGYMGKRSQKLTGWECL